MGLLDHLEIEYEIFVNLPLETLCAQFLIELFLEILSWFVYNFFVDYMLRKLCLLDFLKQVLILFLP